MGAQAVSTPIRYYVPIRHSPKSPRTTDASFRDKYSVRTAQFSATPQKRAYRADVTGFRESWRLGEMSAIPAKMPHPAPDEACTGLV